MRDDYLGKTGLGKYLIRLGIQLMRDSDDTLSDIRYNISKILSDEFKENGLEDIEL